MERKQNRDEAEFQALIRNVRDGQAFMEEKKKDIAEIDRRADQDREDMYVE